MRRLQSLPLIALLTLAGSGLGRGNSHAAWVAGGTTIGRDCGFMVEWASALPDGAGGALFFWRDGYVRARRLDSDGNLIPGWNNCTKLTFDLDSYLEYEHVECLDGAGGAFVLFRVVLNCPAHCTGEPMALQLQRITAAGTIAPGWPANGIPIASSGLFDNEHPAIAPDGAGGVVMAWSRWRNGATGDIYAQRVSAQGQVQWNAGGLAVCTASGAQSHPAIVASVSGGALVFWEDARPSLSVPEVFMRSISPAGVLDARPTGMAISYASSAQFSPVAVADGAGGSVVVWKGGDPDGVRIHGQRVNGALARQWDGDDVVLSGLCESAGTPQLCPDASGGFFLAWADSGNKSATGQDVFSQRFQLDGVLAPGWPADGIAICTAVGRQSTPMVAPDGVGGFFAAWSDARSGEPDLFATRRRADGAPASGWPADGSPVCTVTGDQTPVCIVPAGVGNAIVVWADRRSPVDAAYATRLVGDGPVAVLASLARAVAMPDRVEIAWQLAGDCPSTVTLERDAGAGWMGLDAASPSGTCLLEFIDADVIRGNRYGYRLAWSEGGVRFHSSEAWLDVPLDPALALGRVAGGQHGLPLEIEGSLPAPGPFRLTLLDVAGRTLASSTGEASAPGTLRASLTPTSPPRPGIYFVTLSQRGDRVTRSVVLRR